jgi:hypothetical protein
MMKLNRMSRKALCLGVVALAAWLGLERVQNVLAAEQKGTAPMLVHDVYFTLNDSSPAARQKLVEACDKYLTGHPGTVFYATGVVSDLDRPVNVRDWDVGLHVVFVDQAAHDVYQTAPRHLKFIEENKADWKSVRVFDTSVAAGAKSGTAK